LIIIFLSIQKKPAKLVLVLIFYHFLLLEDEEHLLLVCPNTQKVRECLYSTLPFTYTSTLAELMQITNMIAMTMFIAGCVGT
jgi:hypothetical protein